MFYNIIVRLTVSSLLIFCTTLIFATENISIRVSAILQTSNDNVLSTEQLPKVYSKLIVDVKCELAGNHLILPPKAELLTLNPQLHSRSATYIKRNELLIRKTAIKSSHPFQYAYHSLTP